MTGTTQFKTVEGISFLSSYDFKAMKYPVKLNALQKSAWKRYLQGIGKNAETTAIWGIESNWSGVLIKYGFHGQHRVSIDSQGFIIGK